MKFLEQFTNSVAAAALVVTTAATSVALPEVAEAQTIREPQSCRTLDRELQQMGREDNRQARRAADIAGRAVERSTSRRGSDAGDVARGVGGALLGGLLQKKVYDQYRDDGYINDLRARCDADLARQEAGVCKNRTSERGYVETRNGQVVGTARGGIEESRDCTSQTYGSPGNRTLTGGNAGERYAQEDQYRREASPMRSSRDFSKCSQITWEGKPALACPAPNGAPEIVPLAPAPRR